MKTLQKTLLTILGLFSLLTVHAQTNTARWTRNENTRFLRPQFTAFAAVETGKTVSLNWATSAEKNSSHFIVERSLDGVDFDSVGAVTALGRFDLPTSYEFIDLQPAADSKYYRVLIVDLDGTQSYGRVYKVAPPKELSALR
jgi:hypothetical protein